jgi:hypothetical protein
VVAIRQSTCLRAVMSLATDLVNARDRDLILPLNFFFIAQEVIFSAI